MFHMCDIYSLAREDGPVGRLNQLEMSNPNDRQQAAHRRNSLQSQKLWWEDDTDFSFKALYQDMQSQHCWVKETPEVLGPLIFILFIDDIVDCFVPDEIIPTSPSIFAYDLKLYCAYELPHENSSLINTDSDIETWSAKGQLWSQYHDVIAISWHDCRQVASRLWASHALIDLIHTT